MMGFLHEEIISKYKLKGWKTNGFYSEIKKHLQKPEYEKENPEGFIFEWLKNNRVVPDIWKTFIHKGVLSINCIEVCVSCQLSRQKCANYLELWWIFDLTMNIEFNVSTVDRHNRFQYLLKDTVSAFKMEHTLNHFPID